MPELPEVETVRAGLEKTIKNAVIEKVTVRRRDLRQPIPADFAARVTGRPVMALRRRAKYVIMELDGPDGVLVHLGMSGKLIVMDAEPTPTAHDHVIFRLSGGKWLVFNDPRRFGIMLLVARTEVEKHPLLSHLGPEPLAREFSTAYLARGLARRKGPVKPAIMDQALVVGVGNIYASEALFLAGIDPRTPAYAAAERAGKLVRAIRHVLRAAIASGGSTLRDYVRSSGDAGYFQHEFKVYDREKEVCFQCGGQIQALRQAGRATYFCAHCQG